MFPFPVRIPWCPSPRDQVVITAAIVGSGFAPSSQYVLSVDSPLSLDVGFLSGRPRQRSLLHVRCTAEIGSRSRETVRGRSLVPFPRDFDAREGESVSSGRLVPGLRPLSPVSSFLGVWTPCVSSCTSHPWGVSWAGVDGRVVART